MYHSVWPGLLKIRTWKKPEALFHRPQYIVSKTRDLEIGEADYSFVLCTCRYWIGPECNPFLRLQKFVLARLGDSGIMQPGAL